MCWVCIALKLDTSVKSIFENKCKVCNKIKLYDKVKDKIHNLNHFCDGKHQPIEKIEENEI